MPGTVTSCWVSSHCRNEGRILTIPALQIRKLRPTKLKFLAKVTDDEVTELEFEPNSDPRVLKPAEAGKAQRGAFSCRRSHARDRTGTPGFSDSDIQVLLQFQVSRPPSWPAVFTSNLFFLISSPASVAASSVGLSVCWVPSEPLAQPPCLRGVAQPHPELPCLDTF